MAGRSSAMKTRQAIAAVAAAPMRARPSQITALASRSARVSGDSSALCSTPQESVCS